MPFALFIAFLQHSLGFFFHFDPLCTTCVLFGFFLFPVWFFGGKCIHIYYLYIFSDFFPKFFFFTKTLWPLHSSIHISLSLASYHIYMHYVQYIHINCTNPRIHFDLKYFFLFNFFIFILYEFTCIYRNFYYRNARCCC